MSAVNLVGGCEGGAAPPSDWAFSSARKLLQPRLQARRQNKLKGNCLWPRTRVTQSRSFNLGCLSKCKLMHILPQTREKPLRKEKKSCLRADPKMEPCQASHFPPSSSCYNHVNFDLTAPQECSSELRAMFKAIKPLLNKLLSPQLPTTSCPREV